MIKLIKSALTQIAPAAHQHYRGKELVYITFFQYLKQPEAGADDDTALYGRYWQIDLWVKQESKADSEILESKIITALKLLGFGNFSSQELYEKDTGTSHTAIRCYLLEEV